MSEERERKYRHDARQGDTRFSPRGDDEHLEPDAEPHERLNTPVSEIEAERDEEVPHGPVADVQGMGRADAGGDPVLGEGSRGDRETRNPGQSTPRGELDSEAEAMRRAEEETGVPLVEDDRRA